MDAFLQKESSAVQRPNPRSEQASSANLLFNPNNRRRFVFPTPADKQGSGKGPPLGGGGASGYWQLRTSKRETAFFVSSKNSLASTLKVSETPGLKSR